MKVTLIDHMGSDLTVVNAARVSFDKQSDWIQPEAIWGEGCTLKEPDQKLIKYLATHGHWTPFAHPQVQLHIKAPIFVARQLGKHQVGMVWNEVSRRYVDSEPEFYTPSKWRGRPLDKKQGSSGEIVSLSHEEGLEDIWGTIDNNWHPTLHIQYNIEQNALDQYNWLLQSGVAPEQARMILPQNTYTEWYWTSSLSGWARVYNLRIKEDTQEETREIAKQIGEIVGPLFPVSWEALTNG